MKIRREKRRWRAEEEMRNRDNCSSAERSEQREASTNDKSKRLEAETYKKDEEK